MRANQATSGNAPDALAEEFHGEYHANNVVARTYLTYGWKYKQRIIRNVVSPEVKAIARGMELPKYVWVTEFGTIASFADVESDNRRIFGHCVVDATAKNMGDDSRLLFHAPCYIRARTHDIRNPYGPYILLEKALVSDQPYLPKRRGDMAFH